jgi:PAS domain S-box-containing protein
MVIGELTRLLLVDDDLNMLTSLCDILDYKGYQTQHAINGVLALKSLEEQPVDVALVDLRLADMSGLDLVRKIKERSPSTECILLTGYATQSSAIEAVSSGVFGYFLKPFEIDQVALAIEQAAQKSKSSRALAANERRLRRLIENGRDNILVLDAEGLVTWTNNSVESNWGYTFSAHKDIYTAGYLHPEEREGISDLFKKIVSSPGAKENLTFRIRQTNGEWRWVEGTAVNLLEDPVINGVVVNFRDITERIQFEKNLSQSESRFRSLFEDSPVAIKEENFAEVKKKLDALKHRGVKDWELYFKNHPDFVKECAQSIVVENVNTAAVKLHNAKSKEELLGPLQATLTEPALVTLAEEFINVAKGEVQFSKDTTNLTIDGTPIDVHVSWKIAPEHTEDLSKIIVTLVDISERKEREKEIEKHNQELSLLYNAGRVLSRTLDLEKIYFSFYELVSSIMHCDTMYIADFDPKKEMISARFAISDGKTLNVSGFPPIPLEPEGSGIQSQVIRKGKARVINDYWAELKNTLHNYFISEEGIVVPESQVPQEMPVTRSALVIPILLNTRVVGTVQIQSTELDTYSENDLLIAESMVAQIAVAINNAMLYQNSLNELNARIKAEEELQKKNLLQEKIVALGRELATSMDISMIYKIAEHYLKKMIHCPNYGIILFDEKTQEMIPAFVSSENKALDVSLLPSLKFDPESVNEGRAKAIATRIPVIVNDVETKRKSDGGHLIGTEAEPQSAIYIPMVAEDKVIGLVDLQSYQNNAFSDEEGEWLTVVANMIGLAIQNARLQAGILHELAEKEKAEAEIRQSLLELEMLYENALTVNQLFDADEVGKAIVQLLSRRFPEYQSFLRLRINDSNQLRLVDLHIPGYTKEKRSEVEKKSAIAISRIGDGLSGLVVKTGDVLRVPDVLKNPQYVELYPGIRSGLYVPIKVGQYIIGSITLESEKSDAFSSRDERLLSTIANQAAIAFDNASLYQAVQKELDTRIQTEAALRESQGRLQSILDHTSALVYIKDLQGRYVLANKALASVYKFSVDEVVGKKPKDLLDFPEFNQHEQNDRMVLEKKEPITFEEQHTIQEITNTFLTVKFPIKNEQGEIIALCGISTDITSQKAGKDQLRLMSHMVEQSPAFVVLTDPEGNIEYVNRKFTEELGYQPEEVIGKNPRILKSGYTSREEYQNLWQTIKNGKEWRGEFRNRRKDGTLLWESALISPMFNTQGETTHFLAIKENITSRKEAEFELVRLNQSLEERVNQRTIELHEANKALEKASKLKDEFLASMSHELRTPLTGVLGLSEAMQKGVYGNLNEKQVTILQTIEEGGRHLLNLINDILDLSKIEAGKMELEPNVVSVDEVCQASLRMVKQIANSRQQKLTLTQHPIDMYFYADSKRIKQILVNLLGNAVKFTPETGEVGLEVIGDHVKDEITFTVWDTGIGIAAQDMEKLFQPFVQIDSSLSRNYAGTGLGLSLVDRLVKLHGGVVQVVSEVGKGSRFIVTVPWHKEKVEDKVRQLTVQKENFIHTLAMDEKKQNLGSILIVEDNEVNSAMLSDYLVYKGYNTSIVNSGQEALSTIEKKRPDVVLMDIQMPGINGLEVIRTVRKMHGEISKVGIIALTALAMSEDRQRCMDAGADDYISKPVDMDGLLVAITNLRGKNK